MNLKEYIIEKLTINKDTDIIVDKTVDKIKNIVKNKLEDYNYYYDEGDYWIKISEELDILDVIFKDKPNKYSLRHITSALSYELQNKIKEYTFSGSFEYKDDTLRIKITK